MITTKQKATLLYKHYLGTGSTRDHREFFEEAIKSSFVVTPEQMWTYSDRIPNNTEDTGGLDAIEEIKNLAIGDNDDTYYHYIDEGHPKEPLVKRYYDVKLSAIDAGTDNAFLLVDEDGQVIRNIIPFNYYEDVYLYTLKRRDGKFIPFGVGDWQLDVYSGILTFYGELPDGVDHDNPPLLSFYQYVGGNGFRQDSVGMDGVLIPIYNGVVNAGNPVVKLDASDNTLSEQIIENCNVISDNFVDTFGWDGSDNNQGVALSYEKIVPIKYSSSKDAIKGYDQATESEISTLLSDKIASIKEEDIDTEGYKILFASQKLEPNHDYKIVIEDNIATGYCDDVAQEPVAINTNEWRLYKIWLTETAFVVIQTPDDYVIDTSELYLNLNEEYIGFSGDTWKIPIDTNGTISLVPVDEKGLSIELKEGVELTCINDEDDSPYILVSSEIFNEDYTVRLKVSSSKSPNSLTKYTYLTLKETEELLTEIHDVKDNKIELKAGDGEDFYITSNGDTVQVTCDDPRVTLSVVTPAAANLQVKTWSVHFDTEFSDDSYTPVITVYSKLNESQENTQTINVLVLRRQELWVDINSPDSILSGEELSIHISTNEETILTATCSDPDFNFALDQPDDEFDYWRIQALTERSEEKNTLIFYIHASLDGQEADYTVVVVIQANILINIDTTEASVKAGDSYELGIHSNAESFDFDCDDDRISCSMTQDGNIKIDTQFSSEDYSSVIHITGHIGDQELTVDFTINVSAREELYLSANPDVVNLTAGNSATLAITTNATYDNITVTCNNPDIEYSVSEPSGFFKVPQLNYTLPYSAEDYTVVFTITAELDGQEATITYTVNATAREELYLSANPDVVDLKAGSSATLVITTNASYENISISCDRDDVIYEVAAPEGFIVNPQLKYTLPYSSEDYIVVFTITATYEGQTKTITYTVNVSAREELYLSANPDTVSVKAGTNSTLAITTNATTENITVTCDNENIEWELAEPSGWFVVPQLKYTVPYSAEDYTVVFNITATLDGQKASITYTVNVSAREELTLSANPDTVSAKAGSSATLAITTNAPTSALTIECDNEDVIWELKEPEGFFVVPQLSYTLPYSSEDYTVIFTITASYDGQKKSITYTVNATAREELYLSANPDTVSAKAGSSATLAITTNATYDNLTISCDRDDVEYEICEPSGWFTVPQLKYTLPFSSEDYTVVFTITATLDGQTATITYIVNASAREELYLTLNPDHLSTTSNKNVTVVVTTNGEISVECSRDDVSYAVYEPSGIYAAPRIEFTTPFADEDYEFTFTITCVLDGQKATATYTVTVEAFAELYLSCNPDESTSKAGSGPITIAVTTNGSISVTCDNEEMVDYEVLEPGGWYAVPRIQINKLAYSDEDYVVHFTITSTLGNQKETITYTLNVTALAELYLTLNPDTIDTTSGKSVSVTFNTNATYENITVTCNRDDVEYTLNAPGGWFANPYLTFTTPYASEDYQIIFTITATQDGQTVTATYTVNVEAIPELYFTLNPNHTSVTAGDWFTVIANTNGEVAAECDDERITLDVSGKSIKVYTSYCSEDYEAVIHMTSVLSGQKIELDYTVTVAAQEELYLNELKASSLTAGYTWTTVFQTNADLEHITVTCDNPDIEYSLTSKSTLKFTLPSSPDDYTITFTITATLGNQSKTIEYVVTAIADQKLKFTLDETSGEILAGETKVIEPNTNGVITAACDDERVVINIIDNVLYVSTAYSSTDYQPIIHITSSLGNSQTSTIDYTLNVTAQEELYLTLNPDELNTTSGKSVSVVFNTNATYENIIVTCNNENIEWSLNAPGGWYANPYLSFVVPYADEDFDFIFTITATLNNQQVTKTYTVHVSAIPELYLNVSEENAESGDNVIYYVDTNGSITVTCDRDDVNFSIYDKDETNDKPRIEYIVPYADVDYDINFEITSTLSGQTKTDTYTVHVTAYEELYLILNPDNYEVEPNRSITLVPNTNGSITVTAEPEGVIDFEVHEPGGWFASPYITFTTPELEEDTVVILHITSTLGNQTLQSDYTLTILANLHCTVEPESIEMLAGNTSLLTVDTNGEFTVECNNEELELTVSNEHIQVWAPYSSNDYTAEITITSTLRSYKETIVIPVVITAQEELYLTLNPSESSTTSGKNVTLTITTNATVEDMTVTCNRDDVEWSLNEPGGWFANPYLTFTTPYADEDYDIIFTITARINDQIADVIYTEHVTAISKLYLTTSIDEGTTIAGSKYSITLNTNGELAWECDRDDVDISYELLANDSYIVSVSCPYSAEDYNVNIEFTSTLSGQKATKTVTLHVDAEDELYLTLNPDHSTSKAGSSPITIAVTTNGTISVECDCDKITWEVLEPSGWYAVPRIQINSSEYSDEDYDAVFHITATLDNQIKTIDYTLTFSARPELYINDASYTLKAGSNYTTVLTTNADYENITVTCNRDDVEFELAEPSGWFINPQIKYTLPFSSEDYTVVFTVTANQYDQTAEGTISINVTAREELYIKEIESSEISGGDELTTEIISNGEIAVACNDDTIDWDLIQPDAEYLYRIHLIAPYLDEDKTVTFTITATLDGQKATTEYTVIIKATEELYLTLNPDSTTIKAGQAVTVAVTTNGTITAECDNDKVNVEIKEPSGIFIVPQLYITTEYSKEDYVAHITITSTLEDGQTATIVYTLNVTAREELYITVNPDSAIVEKETQHEIVVDTNGIISKVVCADIDFTIEDNIVKFITPDVDEDTEFDIEITATLDGQTKTIIYYLYVKAETLYCNTKDDTISSTGGNFWTTVVNTNGTVTAYSTDPRLTVEMSSAKTVKVTTADFYVDYTACVYITCTLGMDSITITRTYNVKSKDYGYTDNSANGLTIGEINDLFASFVESGDEELHIIKAIGTYDVNESAAFRSYFFNDDFKAKIFIDMQDLEGQSSGTEGINNFNNCAHSLIGIIMPDPNKVYAITFNSCTSIECIVFPDYITEIASSTCKNCSNLKTLIFSDSLVKIGQAAFRDTALESVTIGEGITSLASYPLSSSALTNLTCYNKNQLTMNAECFRYTALKNMTFGPGGISATTDTFAYLPDIETFTIQGDCTFPATAAGSFTHDSNIKNLIIKNVNNLAQPAFKGLDIETLTIEATNINDTVTISADEVFSDCTSLTTLNITGLGKVHITGDRVFANTSSLTNVEIADTVTIDFSDTTFDGSAYTSISANNIKLDHFSSNGTITLNLQVKQDTSDISALLLYWSRETKQYEPFLPKENTLGDFGVPVVALIGDIPPSVKIGSDAIATFSDSITPDYYGPRNFTVTIARDTGTDNKSADYIVKNHDGWYLNDIFDQIHAKYPDFQGTVFLRAGTYVTNGCLDLSQWTNAIITGEGYSTIIDCGNHAVVAHQPENSILAINNITINNTSEIDIINAGITILSGIRTPKVDLNITQELTGHLFVKNMSFNDITIKGDQDAELINVDIRDCYAHDVEIYKNKTYIKSSVMSSLYAELGDAEDKTLVIRNNTINCLKAKWADLFIDGNMIFSYSGIAGTEANQLPVGREDDYTYTNEEGVELHTSGRIPIFSKNDFLHMKYAEFARPFFYNEDNDLIELLYDEEVLTITQDGKLTTCLHSNKIAMSSEIFERHPNSGLDPVEYDESNSINDVFRHIYMWKADLDENGKVPLQELPDSVAYGGLLYVGTWSFEQNNGLYPTFNDAAYTGISEDDQVDQLQKGWFFIVQEALDHTDDDEDNDTPVSTQHAIDGTDFTAGDWVIYVGDGSDDTENSNSSWQKIDRAYSDPTYSPLPAYAKVPWIENLDWYWKRDRRGGALDLSNDTIIEAFYKVNEELKKLRPKPSISITDITLLPIEDYRTITYCTVNNGIYSDPYTKIDTNYITSYTAQTIDGPEGRRTWRELVFFADKANLTVTIDGNDYTFNLETDCAKQTKEIENPDNSDEYIYIIKVSKATDTMQWADHGEGYWQGVWVEIENHDLSDGTHSIKLTLDDVQVCYEDKTLNENVDSWQFMNEYAGSTDTLFYTIYKPYVQDNIHLVDETYISYANAVTANQAVNDACSGITKINLNNFTGYQNFEFYLDKIYKDWNVRADGGPLAEMWAVLNDDQEQIFCEKVCIDKYITLTSNNEDSLYQDISVSGLNLDCVWPNKDDVLPLDTTVDFYITVYDIYGNGHTVKLYTITGYRYDSVAEPERCTAGHLEEDSTFNIYESSFGKDYNSQVKSLEELVKVGAKDEDGNTYYYYTQPVEAYDDNGSFMNQWTGCEYNGEYYGTACFNLGRVEEATGYIIEIETRDEWKNDYSIDKLSGETQDVILQTCLVDGDEKVTSFLNMNHPYNGFSTVNENEFMASVMYAGNSTALIKRVTFGRKKLLSGDVYVRIGLKKDSGKKFTNIRLVKEI